MRSAAFRVPPVGLILSGVKITRQLP